MIYIHLWFVKTPLKTNAFLVIAYILIIEFLVEHIKNQFIFYRIISLYHHV